MKSILFVTYGDSFRPPMALYILGHLAKDEGIELAVDSAHVKRGRRTTYRKGYYRSGTL